ncbi:YbaK/EbsC family protein [Aliamphritea spongicola]|nr:YbaK/EbsC family protein [Aliamphritea spongicola]
MTPAITLAEKRGVAHKVHSYTHDPGCASYGEEAAAALQIDPAQVYKTLMVALNGDNKQLGVAIVPVAGQLNLKAAAKAFKVKKIAMADPQAAQRSSGYLLGGISPLGQKNPCQLCWIKRLKTGRRYLSVPVSGVGNRVSGQRSVVTDQRAVC